MQLKEAVQLINNDFVSKRNKQVWVDLGCGSGTFTTALASLLPENSLIYAIDKNRIDLNRIPDQFENVTIEKNQTDFIKMELPYNLDGILMANSLHYVKEKQLFIKQLEAHLKKRGCFIIVEYDTEISNTWVPFPVSYNSLKKLFEKEGYRLGKLKEKPSIYRKENIYSALIRK
jgi:ubiquinone/menaquinone biosynthesis C-methylase UbiE